MFKDEIGSVLRMCEFICEFRNTDLTVSDEGLCSIWFDILSSHKTKFN